MEYIRREVHNIIVSRPRHVFVVFSIIRIYRLGFRRTLILQNTELPQQKVKNQ